MFGLFKKKDKAKGNKSAVDSGTDWGAPVQANRKMSKSEMEKEAAEQAVVEQKNRERREVYRPVGTERIILDSQGHRLALRTEINFEHPTPEHPHITAMVFWGAKEIGHVHAELNNEVLQVIHCKTEASFDARGISAELLQEMERLAREKGVKEVCCPSPNGSLDWNDQTYTNLGYNPRGDKMVKTIV
jgi:histone acetyltransferase (RNA polymerase elongator complex component)